MLSFVDPDKPTAAINVTFITQTSVTVSWSTGKTQVVNVTIVYHSEKSTPTGAWTPTPATTGTSQMVTSLQPGTEYEFHVEINSFGKTSKSENINATTGMINYHLTFLELCFSYKFYYLSTSTSWCLGDWLK